MTLCMYKDIHTLQPYIILAVYFIIKLDTPNLIISLIISQQITSKTKQFSPPP